MKVPAEKPFHRVVAELFIGEPPTNDHQINHKNGVKHDNYYENLEWCLRDENIEHAILTGLIQPGKPVYKICPDTDAVICKYRSISNASKQENINASNIRDVCNGTRYRITAGGYKWRFAEIPLAPQQ